MVRIATVYNENAISSFKPFIMGSVRWRRVSSALARLGYQVDMIIKNDDGTLHVGENLRYVNPEDADWGDYDVIKTFHYDGMKMLKKYRVDDHPFIISKLGHVVSKKEGHQGVHFYQDEWNQMLHAQEMLARKAKYITV